MITEEYSMMGKQPDNFLNRVTQALARPIQSRCAELAVLFDRGTMKDLHTVFPLLVENIFGPNGTMCWELRSITSTVNAQDFQALQHFLSPLGPMFKMIYTLLRDPLIKFEFSLSYLPSKIRQNLNGTTMHPFYVDLINVNPQTQQTVSLMLNPFDYYFFHFSYHLINPYQQRSHNSRGLSWSTVYYVLCCDYVIHFLPTNPSNLVLPILSHYNGKNPIYMLPAFNKTTKTSKLLRTDVQNSNKIQSLEHHPRNEIWRSETIMTVFIDMWLNNDLVICGSPYFNNRSYNNSLSPYRPKFLTNELPSGEYIRTVRVLVKQLHSFASSAKVDDTHMGELKKIVIPYLQGRMYTFLRHLLHRWPLDGSFRLVLELWLSFIQPWRYTGNEYTKLQEANADLDDVNTNNVNNIDVIDRDCMQFMAENLLSYTVLLQQLLPRFCKMDLSSPKIALILYRLTKVFAQPNLVLYLREIERSAENISNSPVHSYMHNSTNNLPPLSMTTMWSTNSVHSLSNTDPGNGIWNPEITLNDSSFHDNSYRLSGGKWDNLIKQKILELEGPNFSYKTIFTSTPAPEVYDLIRQIKQSERIAQQIIRLRLEEMKQQTKGFFGFVKSIFITSENNNDEFTLEERKKVPNYLQLSLGNLKQIFQISDDQDNQQQQSVEDISANTTSSFQNDITHMLTPQRVRERLKYMKYEGDPDLLPVRSDEVTILVRLLYQLALKINQDFGTHICEVYNKENFIGSLSRQILSPPITIYNYDKSFPGRSPRVPQNLPPRISLRYFGSQKFMFYCIMAIILSKLCGYGYMTFLFVAFAFWFMYTCLKAACDRRQTTQFVNHNNEDAMDVDSFSANDSF